MKRHVTAVAAIVLSAIVFVHSAGAAIVTPTGYWQFDDGSNYPQSRGIDTSGNGRDLTIIGAYTSPSPGTFELPGLIGGAIHYDGNALHRAARPTSDSVFDVGSSDFTMQVWYKPSASGEQVLLEKFTGPNVAGWTFYKNGGDALEFYANGTLGGVFLSGGVVTNNSWHQLVASRSGNTFTLYLDTVAVATTTIASVISSAPQPLSLGARETGGNYGRSLSGLVDEVAFWNVALSGSDITTLYNGGAGLDVISAIPEPGTATLFAIGGLFFGMRRRRAA